MSWFRRKAQIGSYLALMAVAIQLVVASFHFHPGTLVSAVEPPAAVAASLPSSDTPVPPGTAHDPTCAACILMQLAASTAHPDAPTLDLPAPAQWAAPPIGVPELPSTPSSHPFNARAPPVLWQLG